MRFKGLFLGIMLLAMVSGVHAQVAPVKQVPYYFPPGIQTTTDAFLQRQEYLRYLAATWSCFQGNPNGLQSLVTEPGSYSVQTDIVSTSSVTNPHAKMRLIMDHVVKMPDGQIRVSTQCSQYFITQAQLDFAVKDLEDTVNQAAKDDYDFYNVVYENCITIRAQKLGISRDEFVKQLDDPMPDHADVTYREFNYLPKPVKVSDFVPRELHLGYPVKISGILGVTWLDTGIVYYNPDARIVDWLTGRPKVMSHEMVHNNVDFQRFPLSEGFDVEMMASLPEGLFPENKIDLPNHGYFDELREIDHIYFGFNFAKMQSDVLAMDLGGNQIINKERYDYYAKQLAEIQAENLDFFMHVAVPEFYSDPVWWSAVNQIRGDNDSVFRVMMALHYNPTILGGSKPTLDWLESNKELIMETAQQGFDAGLRPPSSNSDESESDVPMFMIAQYESMFTPAERQTLEAYFHQHPDQLKVLIKMKADDALKLVGTILKSNPKEVPVQ